MSLPPAYAGLIARDAEIFNAAGERVLLRGFNMTHAWGDAKRDLATVPHLARTGANCVRVVFGTFPYGPGKSAAYRREVVSEYARHGLIVVPEDHDGTCSRDPAKLQSIVDQWSDVENVAWLREFEHCAILNIANEWGPTGDGWCAAYIRAVQQLRSAGIRNLIMIDAGGCGQEIRTIDHGARDVWVADPLHNLVFSIHLYGRWHTENPSPISPHDAYDTLRNTKEMLAEFGAPLIVGEFSTDQQDGCRYQVPRLLEIFSALDLGWLAWAWNQNSDAALDIVHAWKYESEEHLTDWGRLVVNELRRQRGPALT